MRFARTLIAERDTDCVAWCLMDNHFHFLFQGELRSVSMLMRDLCSGYAKYFNHKNDRVGALFQGRFKSVPVTTVEQLLLTVRYIHFNPVKAGLPLDYEWSSFREYIKEPYFSSTGLVLGLIGSKDELIAFHSIEPAKIEEPERASEYGKMRDALNGISPLSLQGFEREKRDDCLRALKAAGFSVRQIERATGINRNSIQRS